LKDAARGLSVAAWHEKLGTRDAKVTLALSGTASTTSRSPRQTDLRLALTARALAC
jgi:hypothetical protein